MENKSIDGHKKVCDNWGLECRMILKTLSKYLVYLSCSVSVLSRILTEHLLHYKVKK